MNLVSIKKHELFFPKNEPTFLFSGNVIPITNQRTDSHPCIRFLQADNHTFANLRIWSLEEFGMIERLMFVTCCISRFWIREMCFRYLKSVLLLETLHFWGKILLFDGKNVYMEKTPMLDSLVWRLWIVIYGIQEVTAPQRRRKLKKYWLDLSAKRLAIPAKLLFARKLCTWR